MSSNPEQKIQKSFSENSVRNPTEEKSVSKDYQTIFDKLKKKFRYLSNSVITKMAIALFVGSLTIGGEVKAQDSEPSSTPLPDTSSELITQDYEVYVGNEFDNVDIQKLTTQILDIESEENTAFVGISNVFAPEEITASINNFADKMVELDYLTAPEVKGNKAVAFLLYVQGKIMTEVSGYEVNPFPLVILSNSDEMNDIASVVIKTLNTDVQTVIITDGSYDCTCYIKLRSQGINVLLNGFNLDGTFHEFAHWLDDKYNGMGESNRTEIVATYVDSIIKTVIGAKVVNSAYNSNMEVPLILTPSLIKNARGSIKILVEGDNDDIQNLFAGALAKHSEQINPLINKYLISHGMWPNPQNNSGNFMLAYYHKIQSALSESWANPDLESKYVKENSTNIQEMFGKDFLTLLSTVNTEDINFYVTATKEDGTSVSFVLKQSDSSGIDPETTYTFTLNNLESLIQPSTVLNAEQIEILKNSAYDTNSIWVATQNGVSRLDMVTNETSTAVILGVEQINPDIIINENLQLEITPRLLVKNWTILAQNGFLKTLLNGKQLKILIDSKIIDYSPEYDSRIAEGEAAIVSLQGQETIDNLSLLLDVNNAQIIANYIGDYIKAENPDYQTGQRQIINLNILNEILPGSFINGNVQSLNLVLPLNAQYSLFLFSNNGETYATITNSQLGSDGLSNNIKVVYSLNSNILMDYKAGLLPLNYFIEIGENKITILGIKDQTSIVLYEDDSLNPLGMGALNYFISNFLQTLDLAKNIKDVKNKIVLPHSFLEQDITRSVVLFPEFWEYLLESNNISQLNFALGNGTLTINPETNKLEIGWG